MAIVIHDARPACTYDLTVFLGNKDVVILIVTKVGDINLKLRPLYYLIGRRRLTFRHEDRIIEKIIKIRPVPLNHLPYCHFVLAFALISVAVNLSTVTPSHILSLIS